MSAARACLSAEEVVAYVDGASLDVAALAAHVEGCEACRRCVAATVRAGRDPPGTHEPKPDPTVIVSDLPALAKRIHRTARRAVTDVLDADHPSPTTGALAAWQKLTLIAMKTLLDLAAEAMPDLSR